MKKHQGIIDIVNDIHDHLSKHGVVVINTPKKKRRKAKAAKKSRPIKSSGIVKRPRQTTS
jgi:U3 small nucleolar ribonucleoprotein component